VKLLSSNNLMKSTVHRQGGLYAKSIMYVCMVLIITVFQFCCKNQMGFIQKTSLRPVVLQQYVS